MEQKDRIAAIDVRGNEILDDDVVLMRLKIQPGDAYDPKVVNAELKSLTTSATSTTSKSPWRRVSEGKRLIITVKEKPLIQAISVQGAQELDADDLLAPSPPRPAQSSTRASWPTTWARSANCTARTATTTPRSATPSNRPTPSAPA
jgi:outer membrane protein assembly factor BamA